MVPYVKLGELSIVEINGGESLSHWWTGYLDYVMTSFFLLHVQCNILNSKETLHHNAKLVKIKPMKKYYTHLKSEVELHLQLQLIVYCLPSRSRAIHT